MEVHIVSQSAGSERHAERLSPSSCTDTWRLPWLHQIWRRAAGGARPLFACGSVLGWAVRCAKRGEVRCGAFLLMPMFIPASRDANLHDNYYDTRGIRYGSPIL